MSAELSWALYGWAERAGNTFFPNGYLKSKLLLPDDEDDDFKAQEVAERLKLQLKKLELIRILSDQMLQKKRLGVHIFTRGMKGGIRSINTPVYDVSLYVLLKTYSNIQMQ